MSGAQSTRAVVYALAANGAIAAAKYAAAAFTGSGALLAEAVHSTADCGNQLLLLLGLKRAGRPPSEAYPLGHGKETYFWSFIVAIMLFSLGGLFSLYEGWHKFHEPGEVTNTAVAIAVLGFSLAAEGFSLWGALREVNRVRGGRPLWRWFRETRNAELVVVVGEDLAALVGLSLALAAVLAAHVTGDASWDAAGSMAIGALLIVVASVVGHEVKSLLVGQGVEPAERAAMIRFLEAQPSVKAVLQVLTLHMGADVVVAVKARMADCGTSDALAREINRVEAAFRERFPQVQWTFFEPDVR